MSGAHFNYMRLTKKLTKKLSKSAFYGPVHAKLLFSKKLSKTGTKVKFGLVFVNFLHNFAENLSGL